MPSNKPKFYAVRQGRRPGIYTTWDECKRQVIGAPGAVYKSFSTEEEAKAFLQGGEETGAPVEKESVPTKKTGSLPADPEKRFAFCMEKLREEYPAGKLPEGEAVAFVDGSYEHSLRRYAYGCIFLTSQGPETFSGGGDDPRFLSSRNVAGELEGTVRAAELAAERGIGTLTVYHDYTGIALWVQGDWKAESPVALSYLERMRPLTEKVKIRFVKVKGHSGVWLNELADLLAKKGLEDRE